MALPFALVSPPQPRVSVVVMTFNRPDPLGRCLASLAAQSMPREAFEVVVVDVSRRAVEAVLAPFRSRLNLVHHRAPNRGVAGNRNAGAVRSQGRVLAFLDDDCVASHNWLEELTATLHAHPGSLVGALVEHPEPASAYAAAGQAITEAVDAHFNPPGREPRFVPGLNFAVERERFLACGGCDPGFGRLAAEDRDLVDRWMAAGGRLLVSDRARVRHEHRASFAGFTRQYFNYGRGAWRYHRLRRQRHSGTMVDDIRLHLRLPRYVRAPLRRLAPGMRVRVVLLLVVWQATNLAGFLWQGVLEMVARRPSRGLAA